MKFVALIFILKFDAIFEVEDKLQQETNRRVLKYDKIGNSIVAVCFRKGKL